MKTIIKLLLAGTVLINLLMTGCTVINKKPPMTKIKYGMTRGEVIDILDAPNRILQEKTWRKALIPWKTENDYRTVYYYEGLGSVEFDREGSKVVQNITYAEKENGRNFL